MRSWHVPLLLAAALPVSALGAGAPGDPDWPCQQRLVPELTAGTFWTGPAPPPDADWHKDDRLAALVQDVSARNTDPEDGERQIKAFAASLAPEQRQTVLPELFFGIVDATNQARANVIDRIKDLARRQRDLAALVSKLSDEADAIPEDAQGAEGDRRAEIVQRREYIIRTFDETERTMRYACEAPAQLDAKLGRYARAVESAL